MHASDETTTYPLCNASGSCDEQMIAVTINDIAHCANSFPE